MIEWIKFTIVNDSWDDLHEWFHHDLQHTISNNQIQNFENQIRTLRHNFTLSSEGSTTSNFAKPARRCCRRDVTTILRLQFKLIDKRFKFKISFETNYYFKSHFSNRNLQNFNRKSSQLQSARFFSGRCAFCLGLTDRPFLEVRRFWARRNLTNIFYVFTYQVTWCLI